MSLRYWLGCLFLPVISMAANPTVTIDRQFGGQNPWNIMLWGPVGNGDRQADTFMDWQGAYSDSLNSGALQVGYVYRHALTDQWEEGIYGFTAYNHSPGNQNFWTFNPGMELLSAHWHLSWNLYLPISNRVRSTGAAAWASDMGDYDYTHFSGHDQFDRWVSPSEQTGVGTDFIASYRIPCLENLQVSLGSYYFDMPEQPLGVTMGLATPLFQRISTQLNYSYDGLKHSTLTLTLGFHFGAPEDGMNTSWWQQRVQHNIATDGQANTVPIVQQLTPVSGDTLYHDNVWFIDPNAPAFAPSSGLENCTFEHPCSGLNSQTTSKIAEISQGQSFRDNPTLYLKPGTYAFNAGDTLTLYGNESLIGRSADYVTPATGSSRALLQLGQLVVDGSDGNTDNTVANLQFQNNGNQDGPAILATNVGTLDLQNLQIGSANNADSTSQYIYDLWAVGGQTITMSGSHFYASSNLTGVASVMLFGLKNFTINRSQISATAESNGNNGSVGLGVYGNGSTITIEQSQIQASDTGDNAVGGFGIYVFPTVTAHLLVNNSDVSVHAQGNNTQANILQLEQNSTAVIENSSLSGDISSVGSNQGLDGITLAGHAQLTLSNTTLNAQAKSTNGLAAATDIDALDDSEVDIENSTLIAGGSSAVVTGNTNITTDNQAKAYINHSQLTTDMAGGPSGGEPSGAVSLWSLDHSEIVVNNSTVSAISNNAQTIAVAVQAQGDSQVEVNNSLLQADQNDGNLTPNNISTSVFADDNSHVMISNSTIESTVAGITSEDLAVVSSNGHAQLTVSNSRLVADNEAQQGGSKTLETIGAYADGDSVIRLADTDLNLTGNVTRTSKTKDNGRVIVI